MPTQQGLYPRSSLGLPYPIIGGRNWVANANMTQQSNGTNTGQNSRVKFYIPNDVWDVRFVYANFYGGGSDLDTAGANPITIQAAIETSGPTYQTLYFNGQPSVTIPPNGWAISDPLGIFIAGGTTPLARTFVNVLSGEKWNQNLATWSDGQGSTQSVGEVPNLNSTISDSTGWVICPYIIGQPRPLDPPSFAIQGDSIAYGNGDNASNPTEGQGFFNRVLFGVYPYAIAGDSGKTASGLAASGANVVHRMRLFSGCKYAFCQLGINDLRAGNSLATIKANLAIIWQWFADRGCLVYQTTIMPNTSSSDSWATATNQTPGAGVFTDSVRTGLNDYIRTTPAPLSGFVDTANTVEANSSNTPTQNGGRWLATGSANGPTSDGLHPSPAYHALLATTFSNYISVFPAGIGMLPFIGYGSGG